MLSEPVVGLVRGAIENKMFPGCVVGVIEPGHQDVRAFGKPTYEAGSSIDARSVYDVASLTKTIVTATLMHLLIVDGCCRLTDPVCKYVPEFGANGKEDVRVAHLLSYTLQLASTYFDDWKEDTSLWAFPDLLRLFYEAALKTTPGEDYLYTDATAILLGELIRRLAGADLDALAAQRIFSPLGMRDSTLDPSSSNIERIVPTGYRPDGTLIWGVPNDEKANVAYARGIQSGLAGLFSTAPDILRWIAMVFAEGRFDERSFLSSGAIDLMTLDYYPGKSFRSPLAWGDGPTYQSLGGAGGKAILAKGGFTGCFMVGDITAKKAVVFLSNRLYPRRPADAEPWRAFRRNAVRCLFGT